MPTLPQRLREMARTTGLDGVAELLVEAAEALEQRGEPVAWLESEPCTKDWHVRELFFGFKSHAYSQRAYFGERKPLLQPANRLTPLYTTPQPPASQSREPSAEREALQQIALKLNVMLSSSTELHDGIGDVVGYQIKTGALHAILGIMACVGRPVAIPIVRQKSVFIPQTEPKG